MLPRIELTLQIHSCVKEKFWIKKKYFFSRLSKSFNKFHSSYDVKTFSSCQSCYQCCSSMVKFPPLSLIERDFISENSRKKNFSVSAKEIEDYFLYRNKKVCPAYQKGAGCEIYEYRPVFCRIFGPVEHGSPIPENCIYKNVYGRFKYNEIKEFQREYNSLNIEYIDYVLSTNDRENEKIKLLHEKGRELLSLERYLDARDSFLLSLEISRDREILYEIGWTCIWMKEYSEGLEFFLEALEKGICDIYPSIYYDIANTFVAMNNLDKAEDFFGKAIEESPLDGNGSYRNVSSIYSERTARQGEVKKRGDFQALPR